MQVKTKTKPSNTAEDDSHNNNCDKFARTSIRDSMFKMEEWLNNLWSVNTIEHTIQR